MHPADSTQLPQGAPQADAFFCQGFTPEPPLGGFTMFTFHVRPVERGARTLERRLGVLDVVVRRRRGSDSHSRIQAFTKVLTLRSA